MRVLLAASLVGKRRGSTMMRKRERERERERDGEGERVDGNAFRIVGALYLPINSELPS